MHWFDRARLYTINKKTYYHISINQYIGYVHEILFVQIMERGEMLCKTIFLSCQTQAWAHKHSYSSFHSFISRQHTIYSLSASLKSSLLPTFNQLNYYLRILSYKVYFHVWYKCFFWLVMIQHETRLNTPSKSPRHFARVTTRAACKWTWIQHWQCWYYILWKFNHVF